MVYDDFAAGLHIDFKAGEKVLDGWRTIKYLRYRNDSKWATLVALLVSRK